MIEILNKTNDRVIAKKASNVCTISFTKTGRICFSAAAAEMCKLHIGKYLHFAILNKRTWLIFVNNDNSGYKLFGINKSPSAQVLIESIAITRLIQDMFNHSMPARYYIQQTDHEHMGHPLYEILTHKPINELGK